MNRDAQPNVLEPFATVAGLLLSILAAVSPLFTNSALKESFIDQRYTGVASILGFLGVVISVWLVFEFFRYFYKPFWFGKPRSRVLKDAEGNERSEYLPPVLTIDKKHIIIVFALVTFGSALGFYSLGANVDGHHPALSVLQVVLYVLQFVGLASLISLLMTTTIDRRRGDYLRENLAEVLFETMKKNGLVEAGIELYAKYSLNPDECISLGLPNTPGALLVGLSVKSQDDKRLVIVFSYDGREVLKILSKDFVEQNDFLSSMIGEAIRPES